MKLRSLRDRILLWCLQFLKKSLPLFHGLLLENMDKPVTDRTKFFLQLFQWGRHGTEQKPTKMRIFSWRSFICEWWVSLASFSSCSLWDFSCWTCSFKCATLFFSSANRVWKSSSLLKNNRTKQPKHSVLGYMTEFQYYVKCCTFLSALSLRSF